MRTKKLLLASTALSAALGCGGKKQPQLHGNPKGTHYDRTLADAGVDGAPADGAADTPPVDEPPVIGPPGNPKGAFYDDGLAKPPKP